MFELLGLFLILDDEGVEKPRASHFELGAVGILLYLDTLGIFPSCLEEKVLDFLDFTRHFDEKISKVFYLL